MARIQKTVIGCSLVIASALAALGQSGFVPQAGEYAIAESLPGDQTFPHLSLKTSGGYLVWQDNVTDGAGLGVSARRLDSSLSGMFSSFRVNQQGALDQERPQVALLSGGGAVFVWQGGQQGFQRIYARFLSGSNTWLTGDVLVNTFTNNSQLNPVVATLTNGTVVVAWGSFNQEAANSLQGVYAQRFSATGQKLGGEFLVNQFTAYNQRTPAVAGLADGRFVVVWVSEQQRFQNSVDLYARIYNANGVAVGNEFLVSTDTNVCANPSAAATTDGGFAVAWGQKDLGVRTNGWDIFVRAYSSAGIPALVQRVNANRYGDQFGPKISALGTDYLVAWTSMGQDGSWEGVYGRFLMPSGAVAGDEFRINTATASRQIHPVVDSDRGGRFLVVWSSFVGIANGMDLFAQRYASVLQPLTAPDAPFVTALDQRRLMVTWPILAGFDVANYEVYANGAMTPTAVVTNNMWIMTNLFPASTHTFRLAYVLTDSRRSPLSATATGTTWGYDDNFDGLPDDWQALYWGSDPANWPSPLADSDGDGVSNRNEFLAGTNPMDPNSVLKTRLHQTPQGLFLSWNTQPGLMYQVQTSANLTGWTNLGGPRFAAGYLDSLYVGGSNRGYYRIVRLR